MAGGYQQPTSPAPASGPGALSKRTDSGPAQKLRDLPDAQYGESATFRSEQQAAPLAQTPQQSAPAAQAPDAAPALPTSFAAPTQHPDEPVTAGAALGPGPGTEALGGGGAGYQSALELIHSIAATSTNPEVHYLAALLNRGM